MEELNPLAASRPLPDPLEKTVAGMDGRRHVEAFRLMLYVSDDGEIVETVWNSRDGVTPFVIGARGLEGVTMKHDLWSGDPYAPEHVPNVGDRIFVDLTAERAHVLADRLADLDGVAAEEREELVSALAESWLKKGGAPDLIEVTPELQRQFLELRRQRSLARAYSHQG